MTRSIWKQALLSSVLLAGTTLFAQSATSGGDQQAQPDAQARAGRGGGPGGRRGGAVRGTVTAVSGSNVTLKNEAGETWTIVTTSNTRVMRDFQPSAIAGVQTGDMVSAMGMPDAEKHEVHAMVVMDVSAAEAAKAKANMGKTYITGRITAINDTQLTVMRSDRVSQVITLDETTSLHRGGRMDPMAMQAAGMSGLTGPGMGGGMGMGMGGSRRGAAGETASPDASGESITLADVKVGDSIVGLGSVKGGSFVPTDLRVMERSAGGPGGGRRGAGAGMGNGEAPPPPPPQ